MDKPTLTVVIPTLGRQKEVWSLMESFFKYRDKSLSAEIIVVDQNFSDLLDSTIQNFHNEYVPIYHYKVSFRGLSKAKNYGSTKASGKYICFVDDDAEFLPDTIDKAITLLDEDVCDIVSGRCIDRMGHDSVQAFGNVREQLSLDNFEGKFIESTMFFKTEVFNEYMYDVIFGVGAFYGAEEGYDQVFRMLKDHIRIMFEPEIKFYHPQTVITHEGDAVIRRVFQYKCGTGRLCKKHELTYKFWSRFVKVLLYLPYCYVFKRKNFRYYVAELLGLMVGKIV